MSFKFDVIPIKTFKCDTHEDFKKLQQNKLPFVVEGLELGPCLHKWKTREYLAETGGNRPVTVHVSADGQMDFLSKNFSYKTLPFREFVNRVGVDQHKEYFLSEKEKYYLRSLSDADSRKQAADISRDFPALSEDLVIPALFEENRYFSSVLRIASQGVQLWTHYDVMDNILMVITGEKRVVMFAPSDALNLYLAGDKSQVLDVDAPCPHKFPLFYEAQRFECVLKPGDVLYIPAYWFHNVINKQWGVAVNVFWRSLPTECYDPKDVYGNKDILAGKHALDATDRGISHLKNLPHELRDFYGRRMIQRIQERLLKNT